MIGLTPATISWHMKRLAELGIVEQTKSGRKVSYHVLGNNDEIQKFILSYHSGFWERLSNKLTNIVLDLSTNE